MPCCGVFNSEQMSGLWTDGATLPWSRDERPSALRTPAVASQFGRIQATLVRILKPPVHIDLIGCYLSLLFWALEAALLQRHTCVDRPT